MLGIGYACSYHLLKNNIQKVFILSVSKEVVDGARDAIAKDLGEEAADRTRWVQCDLADWNKVAEVSKQIRQETDRLDILINNRYSWSRLQGYPHTANASLVVLAAS